MGQDRQFTPEEKLFALRTVQMYRDRWEQSEIENLKSDIEIKVANMESDKIYKETHEALDATEIETRAEAAAAPKEGDEPITEDTKIGLIKKAKFEVMTQCFYDPEGTVIHQRQLDRDQLKEPEVRDDNASPDNKVDDKEKKEDAKDTPIYYPCHAEQWKKSFLDLRKCHIIKNPRVLQTLFYLLGYTREEICERGTNALDFKLAKELINETLFQKMG